MIVKGVDIAEPVLTGALAALGPAPFGLRDLSTALEAAGVDPANSYDAAKRLLQRERKARTLIHDQTSGLWSAAGSGQAGVAPPPSSPPNAPDASPPGPPPFSTASTLGPAPTLPLHPGAASSSRPTPRSKPAARLKDARDFRERARDAMAHLACFAAVGALALINASFAWEISETAAFRVAFVSGLMASDLMRPLLVARGLFEMARGQARRGALAMATAFLLAPVSVFSSTAVISAALHLGAEEIDREAAAEQTRAALRAEHERLKLQAAQAWTAWKAECDRGGCGPKASEREATARALEAEARDRLTELIALPAAGAEGPSSFLSRTVKAYRDLGLFDGGTEAALPLLLALTLEIAALFGPGLLLGERRPPAP